MKMNANVKILGRLTPHKFPWQENVIDIQVDATLDVTGHVAGDRYIITNSAALHASFGTITGVGNGDIVESNGSTFDIVWDASANGEGAKVYDKDSNGWYEFDGTNWNAEASSSVSALNDLSDATISAPASGHILVYDGTDSFDNVAMSGDVTISSTGVTTVNEANVDHDLLSNFVANEHIDHTSVTITAGLGLSGGGDISASRTIDLDLSELVAETVATGDFIPFEDITDGGTHKVTVANLNAAMSAASLSDSADIAFLAQNEAVTGTWTFNTALPTSSLTPSASNELTTKAYVDNAISGLSWKDAVDVATTANITLSGEQTIDGVLTSGSRVLVKNQSTGSENGIYVSAAGAWSRASDMDSSAECEAAAVFVKQGTANADKGFVQTADSVTIDTTSLTFVEFFGGAALSGGNGIDISSGVISADLLASGGLKFSGIELAVEPADFAGTGLEDDGADNLRLAAQGNGIAGGAGSTLSVDPATEVAGSRAAVYVGADGVGIDLDNTTLDHSSSVLQIKNGGVDTTQLADDAVTAAKIAAGALSRYTTATHASGTAVAINHALGLTAANACHITMHDVSTGEQVLADSYTFTDGNNVTLNFASSVGANSLRINISSAEDV